MSETHRKEKRYREVVRALRQFAAEEWTSGRKSRCGVLYDAAEMVSAACPSLAGMSWALWSLDEPTGERFATVYLHFDAAGRLLYVGETSRGFARQLEHSNGKPWYSEIAETRLVHVSGKSSALAVESFLIQTMRPEMNIALNAAALVARSDVKAALDAVRTHPEQSARALRIANRRGILLASEARVLEKLERFLRKADEAAA